MNFIFIKNALIPDDWKCEDKDDDENCHKNDGSEDHSAQIQAKVTPEKDYGNLFHETYILGWNDADYALLWR